MGNKISSILFNKESKLNKFDTLNLISNDKTKSFEPPNIYNIRGDYEVLECYEYSTPQVNMVIANSTYIWLEKFSIENKEIPKFELSVNENINLTEDSDGRVYFHKAKSNLKLKKYAAKELKYYCGNSNANNEYTLEYYKIRNVFKEMKILKEHQGKMIPKLYGHFFLNNTIYFVYDYYENTLEYVLLKKVLNLKDKIKVWRELLDLIKFLHTRGIVSLELSVKNLGFTRKKHRLKLLNFIHSINMNSKYDIDRNATVCKSQNFDPFNSPEIKNNEINKISWQSDIWSLGIVMSMLFSTNLVHKTEQELREKEIIDYVQYVHDSYIKCIILGLLEQTVDNRPTIFEVIDAFNEYISKHIQIYPEENYFLTYTNKEVQQFNKIFYPSTYKIFNKIHPIQTNEIEMPERIENEIEIIVINVRENENMTSFLEEAKKNAEKL